MIIFVFGSNEAGFHGAGAAAEAYNNWGAAMGIGEGICGQSYAIPTKDKNIKTLPISKIKEYVDRFIEYAKSHPEAYFFVTKIGCGLAGYKDGNIAPLFEGAPGNCHFSSDWAKLMYRQR